MVSIAALPSVEVALITELTTHFGSGYRFYSILPADILVKLSNEIVVTRVKRVAGGPNQGTFMLDRPTVDVDTFYGDYGTADQASRNIQAALFDLRGKQLMIGVVQSCRAIVGPRWLPDPDEKLYRFGASYQFNFRAGGITV